MGMDQSEVCDSCNAELEPSQIGLCDSCQPAVHCQEYVAKGEGPTEPTALKRLLDSADAMNKALDSPLKPMDFSDLNVGIISAEDTAGLWAGCHGRTYQHGETVLLSPEQAEAQGALAVGHTTAKQLHAYQVGDNDIVAHFSPEEAKAFMVKHYAYPGDDEEGVTDVVLVSDALLDAEMREECGKLATSLRQDLKAAAEPCYLHGWE